MGLRSRLKHADGGEKMGANESLRNLTVDQSKSFVMLCVVILHSSLAYLSSNNYMWVVTDSSETLIFDCTSRIFDIILMPAFFYFSGTLFSKSMHKYNFYNYICTRTIRLAFPFILGVIFLSPIVQYINVLDKGGNSAFFHFWLYDYLCDGMTSRHLWFLSSLFLFQSFLFLPLKQNIIFISQDKVFAIFLAGIFLMASLSRMIGDSTWIELIHNGIIRFQPAKSIAYIIFFLFGIFGVIDFQSSSKKGYKGLVFFFAFIPIEICFSVFCYANIKNSFFLSLVDSMLYFILAYTFIDSLLFVFRKFKFSFFIDTAQYTYGIYVLHFSIVVIVQFLLKTSQINVFLKFASTLIVSLLFSILIQLAAKKILQLWRKS